MNGLADRQDKAYARGHLLATLALCRDDSRARPFNERIAYCPGMHHKRPSKPRTAVGRRITFPNPPFCVSPNRVSAMRLATTAVLAVRCVRNSGLEVFRDYIAFPLLERERLSLFTRGRGGQSVTQCRLSLRAGLVGLYWRSGRPLAPRLTLFCFFTLCQAINREPA